MESLHESQREFIKNFVCLSGGCNYEIQLVRRQRIFLFCSEKKEHWYFSNKYLMGRHDNNAREVFVYEHYETNSMEFIIQNLCKDSKLNRNKNSFVTKMLCLQHLRHLTPKQNDFEPYNSSFWFHVHSKMLEEGIRVMNAIEDARFPLMLNRIAQFLSCDVSSKPFTNIEESKLEVSLEISGQEVQLLINAALEIFKKCAYYVVKPSVLGEQLEKILNLNPKKAEAFVQVWASSAKDIIDNLKHKPYLFQLIHMSYSLSIETASNLQSREKLPKAQLQLGLSNDKKRDDVNIEFTHDELYDFYKRLEHIQEQLDALK